MKKVLLTYIVFFMSILTLCAQSAKSDSLFAEGVSLYGAGKYEEAIPIFKQCEKMDKEINDTIYSPEEYSAMWLASCYYKLGDTIQAQKSSEYYRFIPVNRLLIKESDKLSVTGALYYQNGDYQNAYTCFVKVLEIEQEIIGDNHVFYGNTLNACVNTLFQLGDSLQCLMLAKKYADIIKNNYDIRSDKFYEAILQIRLILNSFLFEKEDKYIQKVIKECMEDYFLIAVRNNGKRAIDIYNEGSSLLSLSFFENNDSIQGLIRGYAFGLGASYFQIADSLNKHDDINKAIEYADTTLLYLKNYYFEDSEQYAKALLFKSACLTRIDEILSAIEIGEKAKELREKIHGSTSLPFAECLVYLAVTYSENKQFDTAFEYLRKALYIYENYTDDYKLHGTALRQLSNLNGQWGNYNESIIWGEKALHYIEEHTLDSKEYRLTYIQLSYAFYHLGRMKEAYEYAEKASQYSFGNEEYYEDKNNISTVYFGLGEYSKGLQQLTDVANYYRSKNKIDKYYKYLSTIALFHNALNEHYKALQIRKEIADYYSNQESQIEQYAKSLMALSDSYAYVRKYKNALIEIEKATSIIERIYGKDHITYATYLKKMADCEIWTSNYKWALLHSFEASKIAAKEYGNTSLKYSEFLPNIASCYSYLDSLDRAIDVLTEVIEILENNSNTDIVKIGNQLRYLANLYALSGNDLKSIDIGEKALNIKKNRIRKDTWSYISSLRGLSGSWMRLHNDSLTTYYSSEALNCIKDVLLNSFTHVTSNERKLLLIDYESFLRNSIPLYAYLFRNQVLVSNAFNSLLASKGLLLSCDMEFQSLLKESSNEETNTLFQELQLNKRAIENALYNSSTDMSFNIDSLQKSTDNIERELITKSKEYGDFTKSLIIEWTDVQKRLSEIDIAVEFSRIEIPENRIQYYRGDSIMYIAFVIKKGCSNPIMIPLFEERQLNYNGKDTDYKTSHLSQLIWKPLEPFLEGIKNIYFAPSGKLYNIAIESVPHWEEKCLVSDKWNFYRMSSTRELVLSKKINKYKQASIFGGIKYDSSSNFLIVDSKRHTNRNRSLEIDIQTIADSITLRNGVSYLPATKVEVENINKMLENKIATNLIIDSLATEPTFKELSGKETNLLHIATHGFYWTEKETKYLSDYKFLQKEGTDTEDKALTRSGLLLAGANNTLKNEPIPEGVDDGILTAKEISQLDLRGLDLVVLSACQTGLGEITGDGVFGLQRGFKKAGANTLMMSLWKVDDNATQMLMTRFYENLFQRKNPETGKAFTKFEALKEAQAYIREFEQEAIVDESIPVGTEFIKEIQQDNKQKESKKVIIKPYQDPKYWAAFILLDAIV